MSALGLDVAVRVKPALGGNFLPAAVVNRVFQSVLKGAGEPLVIGLQREGNEFSRFETLVFPENHPQFELNHFIVERIVKFLLWQRGGYRLYIAGPRGIAKWISQTYSARGERAFDYRFMGRQVYENEFRVVPCPIDEMPQQCESGKRLGRNLRGSRVGFDLGASDRKTSAVIDGDPVYSEEVIWEPRLHADPDYHYQEILAGLKSAASHLPRLDAIGGSSAGIYIDNRPMVASIFRGVPAHRFGEVKDLFRRLEKEMGAPLVVINDGDVTALAGSMSLEDNGILGIALGSSEAAGYVDQNGHITGWLNELAFAPIDYSPTAPADEWSGDIGCGASYLSQQCVFRLAAEVGIEIPGELNDAQKLRFVQLRLEDGHAGAQEIWKTMGIYLGYALAHYAAFYDIRHVLILGRCTSGSGGPLLLNSAQQVLDLEFPELSSALKLHLPDEMVRRVGQAVAAASLPEIQS